ncbi:MAG TPA: TonB family protein [Gammaproteobacteria bacterium]|jgi:protein TonB
MLRYFGSFALGLLMVMGVLIAMQSLVVGRQFQLNAAGNSDTSAVVNLNGGNAAQAPLSIGALPAKPGPGNRAPSLPEENVARAAAPDLPLPNIGLPSYKPQFLAGATQSVAESEPENTQPAPASGTAPAAQPVLAVGDIVLMERVEPKFPTQAIREDINSGSVTVKFTVEPDGSVSNPSVIDAKPRRGVFDDAALRAVVRWKFKPIAAPRDTQVVVEFNRGGGG